MIFQGTHLAITHCAKAMRNTQEKSRFELYVNPGEQFLLIRENLSCVWKFISCIKILSIYAPIRIHLPRQYFCQYLGLPLASFVTVGCPFLLLTSHPDYDSLCSSLSTLGYHKKCMTYRKISNVTSVYDCLPGKRHQSAEWNMINRYSLENKTTHLL